MNSENEFSIVFNLNGDEIHYLGDPTRRLLNVLREDYHLTGVKEGCGEGECGACAILVDGHLYNSCLMMPYQINHKSVLTIEGFRESKRFEIISRAFEAAGAVQCGFCTPGMVMATEALLRKNPHPLRDEIASFMSGNLCRCTGYDMIIKAVMIASEAGDGLW